MRKRLDELQKRSEEEKSASALHRVRLLRTTALGALGAARFRASNASQPDTKSRRQSMAAGRMGARKSMIGGPSGHAAHAAARGGGHVLGRGSKLTR